LIELNRVYFDSRERPERYQHFMGGSGSGKSTFLAKKFLIESLSKPYFRLVFCRKVSKSIRNSTFLLFKDVIEEHFPGEFEVKETTMDIKAKRTGNLLLSAGLDDVNKLKSIADPSDIWAEEATELSLNDFLELDRRLRTIKAPNHIYFSYNPESVESWIYKTFYQQQIYKDVFTCKTTYRDNKFLSPQEFQKYEALKLIDENQYQIYSEGNWGTGNRGLIYTNWRTVDRDFEPQYYGLDFGFNDPCALVGCRDEESGVIAKELIYSSGLITSDVIKRMEALNIDRSTPVYCDSAEPDRIEEICQAGFNAIPQDKDKGSLLAGIDLLKEKPLFITEDSPNIHKELRAYVWKQNKDGVALDVPVDFMNHSLDAIRASTYTFRKRTEISWF
jgi:phage terminase large subunit